MLGSDVYKSVADHVREKFERPRDAVRLGLAQAPAGVFEKLDQAISDALARDGPWVGQQAGRVTLWGHSYGGLLIRSYIDEARAARAWRGC